MAQKSIKVILNASIKRDDLTKAIVDVMDATIDEAAHLETDSLYHVTTGEGRRITIKVRSSSQSGADQIVLEKAEIDSDFRRSAVVVTDVAPNSRTAPPEEVLGRPDHVIKKIRTIFTSKKYPRLRLYLDSVGTQFFLELQLRASQSEENDTKRLFSYINELGLSHLPTTTLPYSTLILPEHHIKASPSLG